MEINVENNDSVDITIFDTPIAQSPSPSALVQKGDNSIIIYIFNI